MASGNAMSFRSANCVSFVITGYNVESTVRAAVFSALKQDAVAHEVVYVDDGSDDQSLNAIDDIKDARLVLLPLERSGRPVALNAGIAAAKSDLIAILDADDIALPSRAISQLRFLDQNEWCDAVGGQMEAFDAAGRIDRSGRMRSVVQPADLDARIRRGRMPLAHSALMFRRRWFELSGGYDPSVPRCEDFDLVLRGWRVGNYAALPDLLTRCRVGSLFPSWSYWRRDEDFRRAVYRRWQRGDSSPLELDARRSDVVSDAAAWTLQLLHHQFTNSFRSRLR
jgi:glycosyltransferase involved in cell wall biosynthesis